LTYSSGRNQDYTGRWDRLRTPIHLTSTSGWFAPIWVKWVQRQASGVGWVSDDTFLSNNQWGVSM